MLSVRPADKHADLHVILEGAYLFAHEAGMLPYLPDTPEGFGAAIGRILFLPAVEVLLAFEGDACVGGVGLNFSPFLWNPALLVGEELFLWVLPDAPKAAAFRLIRAAQQRMKERGVTKQVWASLPTSPKAISAVYQKMGLRLMQSTFIGDL